MTTIKAPPKECEQCGHLYRPDPSQSYERWVVRRFCSRDCWLTYRTNHLKHSPLDRQIAIRMYADKQNRSPALVLRHRVPSTEACPVWRITIIKK